MDVLLGTRGAHGQDPLDKAVAFRTVRAKTPFPPQDGGSERLFREVVGRLHPGHPRKRPELSLIHISKRNWRKF